VTSTAAEVPVRSHTTTDDSDTRGAERWVYWSRVALIAVALAASVPSPLGVLFGGRTQGSPWLALLIAFLWGTVAWVLWRWRRVRGAGGQSTLPGVSLALDVVGLTALLAISGAAQNPFTLLYFVPMTLATVVVDRWTWRVAGLSVMGFALLLLKTSATLAGHQNHPHHTHFFQHVQGMAIALAVAGAFLAVFVHKIGRALSEQRQRIFALSRERQQDKFAISLGALSAGAAHELGSPLGSIQLLAEELPHLVGREQQDALDTIVSEVKRMKAVLHGMDTGQLSADLLGGGQCWSLDELGQDAETYGVKFEQVSSAQTTQPQKIVSQIVRELLRNACTVASAENVRLCVEVEDEEFCVRVVDAGPGLTLEQKERAQEPFVSFTGGTGLGLFLATVHARQLGGRLALESEIGIGTSVALCLPLRAPVLGRGTCE
jgi:two-component system, sensor histidine kinase RegB